MINKRSGLILWSGACFFFVASLLFSLRVLTGMRQSAISMANDLGSIRQLCLMEAEVGRHESALARFEDAAGQATTSLGEMLMKALPGRTMDEVRELESRSVAGWRIRNKELALADVPLQKVVQFLRMAEAEKPGWRVVRCRIKSSPYSPGNVRIEVLLQTAEKM